MPHLGWEWVLRHRSSLGASIPAKVLSMAVEEVMAGPTLLGGTALLGTLDGQGWVHAGDTAVCGARRMEILYLERFGELANQTEAGTGAVALAVPAQPDLDALKGERLEILPRPDTGVPALAETGYPVPDQAVLVAWSKRRMSPGRHFAVLILDGMRVILAAPDGERLIDASGDQLAADTASSTQVKLRAPDGIERWVVGPLPAWGERGKGAEMVREHHARLLPDPLLTEPEGSMAKFMVTPATARVRVHQVWPTVLIRMLRTRGVLPLDN
ncbi:MAG TPA: hypothetical protein VMD09_17695 [Solirubrobacteraceae bacterium]|nr:hypothetical protein [Solirubrobacteraceae bacterium]